MYFKPFLAMGLITEVSALPQWHKPSFNQPSRECPPVNGTFYVNEMDLYPESVDWDPIYCKLYIRITNHGTINYTAYHLNGIDYDARTGLIYIAATNADAFVSTDTGNYLNANYTGINRILQYGTRRGSLISDIDLAPAQQEYKRITGSLTSGFQDMAENTKENSYAMGTFGNSIAKIAAEIGNVSHGEPRELQLQGLPSNYRPQMADGLFGPRQYDGKIALWSDNYNGTAVYGSIDGWASVRYLGLVPNDDPAANGSFATATVEIGSSIFVVETTFQFVLPPTPKTRFPFIDITKNVRDIVDRSDILELRGEIAPELRGRTSFEKRDGISHNIFYHEATGAKLDFVKNSGICETTPGVNQYSGYVTVGTNQSMWFWFFESRNKPEKAPLALWVNGGPGCSSMIGLFQELGPCHFVNNSTTPSLNPYSWNEYANLLFVDEPIGAGFSYGNLTVNSTVTAAPFVWTLMQAFYANFPQYKNRDFGLFTESYGGHYGPEFASYFEAQNAAIHNANLTAQPINLIALGINNGWYDAKIQEIEFVNFSLNNTYKPLINATIATQYKAALTTGCLPYLQNCTAIVGQNTECLAARKACDNIDNTYGSYYPTNFDYYDIRQPASSPFPPETYNTYLQDATIQKKIGAKSNYTECSDPAGNLFGNTADCKFSPFHLRIDISISRKTS
ncbi:hypothetical protein G7Y89_g9024 [Cudoniella acicularis]|uniref:Carboxypeptidase n=1 Tax=Cudoniella acicularis TaxID=354080 RepID=A0A8H4RHR9_9HELO|nr:hypothetical protein G7Y89_g9024 [Cudoniella acicularis]